MSKGRGRKRVAECFDVADPAKKGFDIEQRGFLRKFRPRLVSCVFKHHAEILQKKPSRSVDSTQTLVAMPVKTRWRIPRLRKMLSSGVLKKPL